MVMMKPALVCDGRSSPGSTLFPLPKDSAGWHLCHVILGWKPEKYFRRFDRIKLDVIESAPYLLCDAAKRPAVFLLGEKTCRAFSVPYAPWSVDGRLYVLPHPSMRNQIWKEPAAIPMTRQFVLNVLDGVDPYKERDDDDVRSNSA